MTEQISTQPPKIVMVETSHPGNIGAAARAMKTMSLHDLALVAPKEFPSPEATARAAAASDVLENAGVYDSLADAITDCNWVIGITARSRKISATCYSPRALVKKMHTDFAQHRVALVFGRERNGLTNEELDLCQAICTIPTNPACSSLNIAAAIQVLSYEWLASSLDEYEKHTNDSSEPQVRKAALEVSSHELEGLYDHLWRALAEAEFFSTRNPAPLMRKLRKMIVRAQLSRIEINILRGILKTFMKQ